MCTLRTENGTKSEESARISALRVGPGQRALDRAHFAAVNKALLGGQKNVKGFSVGACPPNPANAQACSRGLV